MQKLPRGELPPGHEGGGRALPPWVRPLPRGPTMALLHLSLHPSSSSVSHKHEKPTQARVPAPVAVIFDLLAQSTSRKTTWGDCSLKIMKRLLRGSSSRSSKEKQKEEEQRTKFNLPRTTEVRPCEWPSDDFLRGARIYEDY